MDKNCGKCSATTRSDGDTTKSLMRCSRCRGVYYCGKSCQTLDWAQHKLYCTPPTQKISTTPTQNESININNSSEMKNENISWWANKKLIFEGKDQPDDVIYPKDCKKIEIKRTQMKGRGVFAKERIRKGEELLFDSPFVSVSYQHIHSEYGLFCGNCLKPNPFVHPLTREKMREVHCDNNNKNNNNNNNNDERRLTCKVIFCSEECREAARTFHSYFCVSHPISNPAAIADIHSYCNQSDRLLPLLAAFFFAKLFINPIDEWRKVKDLIATKVEIDEIPPEMYREVSLIQNLFPSVPQSSSFITVENYIQAVSLFRTNNISVKTIGVTKKFIRKGEDANEHGNWIEGMGLFPFASMFNHSCHPNLSIQRTITHTIQFVALIDISKGDELTFDYLGINQSELFEDKDIPNLNEDDTFTLCERFVDRQKKMKETFACFCQCNVCLRDHLITQKVLGK